MTFTCDRCLVVYLVLACRLHFEAIWTGRGFFSISWTSGGSRLFSLPRRRAIQTYLRICRDTFWSVPHAESGAPSCGSRCPGWHRHLPRSAQRGRRLPLEHTPTCGSMRHCLWFTLTRLIGAGYDI